jgi:hypothetical protein
MLQDTVFLNGICFIKMMCSPISDVICDDMSYRLNVVHWFPRNVLLSLGPYSHWFTNCCSTIEILFGRSVNYWCMQKKGMKRVGPVLKVPFGASLIINHLYYIICLHGAGPILAFQMLRNISFFLSLFLSQVGDLSYQLLFNCSTSLLSSNVIRCLAGCSTKHRLSSPPHKIIQQIRNS